MYEVYASGETTTYDPIDQQLESADGQVGPGRWVSLGVHTFTGDGTEHVKLHASGDGANGTSADAVMFRRSSGAQYLLYDVHGSTRALVDATGEIITNDVGTATTAVR